MSGIRKIGTAGAVFVIAAVSSTSLATYIAERVAYQAPGDVGDQYTHAAYDSATMLLSGELSEALATQVRTDANGERLVAVVLRAADIPKCEDLGRQVRSLRATLKPSDRFELWAAHADTDAVRTFLELERIGAVPMRAVDVGTVLDGRDHLPTPAALVVGLRGELIEGVAHPARFRNLRPRSFAEELTSLRPSGGSSARP